MNRKLVLILSLVLSLALATGGTLAYLQDTDADVNVMTLGNVHIEQHEYERVEGVTTFAARSTTEGYTVQPFTQNKPLYPVVGTVTGWDEKPVYWAQLDEEHAAGSQKVLAGLTGVVDKFVLVENTGNSGAYVRTVFAFEMGSLSEARFDALLGINLNDTHWDWNFNLGTIEIDGSTYWLAEAVYKGSDVRHTGGILSADDYTYNSLAQVYLASAATNEDVEAIDGNDNGTYDILVVSQAVQAAGFDSAKTALDAAFGEANAQNAAEWFGGVALPRVAYTAAELSDFLEEGGSVIVGKDIAASDPDDYSMYRSSEYGTHEWYANVKADAVLNLNGQTVSVASHPNNAYSTSAAIHVTEAELTIQGEGTVDAVNCTYVVNVLKGTVNIEGGKYIGSMSAGNDGVLNIKGGTFIGGFSAYFAGTINVSGGFFDMNETYGLSIPASAVLNISGGYFEHFAVQNNRGVISISGGSFDGFDPTAYLAEGCVATQADGIWTVTAK